MPSLPTQVGRLLSKIDNPVSTSRDVERLILPDATLSAKVLKMANSVFYCRIGHVNSVSDALVRLGFKTTRSLIITVWTHTLKAFSGDGDDLEMLSSMLGHGAACAVVTKALMEHVEPSRAEDSFVAALLHDIGRIGLICQIREKYETEVLHRVADDPSREIRHIEEEVLGFDHSMLGAKLMEKWHLPQLYIETALNHHAEEIKPAENNVLAAVALADTLVSGMGYNVALNAVRPSRQNLVDYFRIADMDAFLTKCATDIHIMAEVLNEEPA